MEYTYYTDLLSMIQALAAGAFMGVYYDAFRFLRRIVHFSSISVALQDLFFWLSSAVYLFFVCVRLNNGYIRIYFVLFAFMGWGVYFATFGRVMFVVFDFMIKILKRFFRMIKKHITRQAIKIYINSRREC